MPDSSLHTATSSGPDKAIEMDVLDGQSQSQSQSQRPQSNVDYINDGDARDHLQASVEPIAPAQAVTLIGGGITDPNIPIAWRVILVGCEVLGAMLR